MLMADYRKYILKRETLYKLLIVVLVIIAVMLLMHLIVGLVKVDLIDYFNSYVDTTSFIVDFAPEIWLTKHCTWNAYNRYINCISKQS